MKKKLEELKAKLAGLKDRIEADDQEAIAEGVKLKGEIETMEAAIAEAEEKAGLLKLIGKKTEQDGDSDPAPQAKSLGENFVNHLKANPVGKRFNLAAPAFKSASDTQKSPAGAVDFATTFDKNVVEAARERLVIRDLFGAESISGSTLVYLVEGAIEGAPDVIAEGAKKAQVHFADPTPKTVSLKKIACFIKESDEYINDYPFLASAINGRLLYELGLVEQNTLITDLLGTSGIQTDTASWDTSSTATDVAELILDAAMDVEAQSGFAADVIVINPTDWYTLRIAKDGDDRYYGGGFFGAQGIPNLWGIPVCVTTATAAGTIIVGAFKTCASVVSNGGVSVEATNTDADDFQKNLMTIRAEERLALAVRRPLGFKTLVKGE